MRRALLALVLALAPGCGGAERHPDDDPPSADAVQAPPLAPPPAHGDAIGRDEALRLARSNEEPDAAIRALDARRFGFALDDATVDWFGQQGLEPQVLDYLRKRARVDWEALRGDVDPESPGAE